MSSSLPHPHRQPPWVDDYVDPNQDVDHIDEYDITSTPNDFNIRTLFDFIDHGFVKVPRFQRNYVWSLPMASRLIESLLRGLPVPQLFLYEQGPNNFLIIDGQQRLLSLYFFIVGRFPRKEYVVQLRQIFNTPGQIARDAFADDEHFRPFRLWLPSQVPDYVNKFHRLAYADLDQYKLSFDSRPVRTVVVRQNRPTDDTSSVFEIFNRLNTGGMNLRPQEIRASLYYSPFYDMLADLNHDPEWRRLLRRSQPDPHMKDVEVMVRAFAMLLEGEHYSPSMIRFLNNFSRLCQQKTSDEIKYLRNLFTGFLRATAHLPDDILVNPNNNRINLALFEAIFTAACTSAYRDQRPLHTESKLSATTIKKLAQDSEFRRASEKATTDSTNVATRLRRGRVHIPAL